MNIALPPIEAAAGDYATVALDAIEPWPGNPRRGDIEGLRLSLRRFGQPKPILVQRSSRRIVAGNQLYTAMLLEEAAYQRHEDGMRHFEGIHIVLTDLSDVEARAYLVADNRWSERGDNDPQALAVWLAGLVSDGAVDDALGYTSQDIDRLLHTISTESAGDDDAPPLPVDVWVKPGEMYQFGRHRLLVGDATDPANYERLLDNRTAGLIWTDPPYGVFYDGGHSERETLTNDARDEQSLRTLLDASLAAMLRWLKPGSAIYCCAPGGPRAFVFLSALREAKVYKQTIVWVKDSIPAGFDDYRWRHEPVHLGVKEKAKRTSTASSNLMYGWRPGAAHYFVADRALDTVWEIPRPRTSAEHPTMKPVELVERCILASSRRNDVVLDPFAGSGTTAVAAERNGRSAYLMELEPGYAQVTLERMRTLFDLEARLVDG